MLALAALRGAALGRLGQPAVAPPAAWAAAGAAVRLLHEAPVPPWPGEAVDALAARLDDECEWLLANDVLPPTWSRATAAWLRGRSGRGRPVFTHGDLQIAHVFVEDDEVTGVLDWSEAQQGDALRDLATLTLGHEEHLGDVLAGYGTDVDLGVIEAWWSMRSLLGIRWLIEHGFDPAAPGCEIDVLRARL